MRDENRGKVYVGGSLRNSERVAQIIDRLQKLNVKITYNWTKHGQVFEKEELKRIAIAEEQGVKDCQVFFMVFPGRTGTHIEFGIARGHNKLIVLLREEEVEDKSFYYLPGVEQFETEDQAIKHTLDYLDARNR